MRIGTRSSTMSRASLRRFDAVRFQRNSLITITRSGHCAQMAFRLKAAMPMQLTRCACSFRANRVPCSCVAKRAMSMCPCSRLATRSAGGKQGSHHAVCAPICARCGCRHRRQAPLAARKSRGQICLGLFVRLHLTGRNGRGLRRGTGERPLPLTPVLGAASLVADAHHIVVQLFSLRAGQPPASRAARRGH